MNIRTPIEKSLLRRREDGAVAVEFGLIAPVVAAMLLLMVDIGSAMYTKMEILGAVRAGAQQALVAGAYSSADIQTVVQASTELTSITVVSSQSCECWDTTGPTLTETLGPTLTETLASCTATCSVTTDTKWKFVTVQGSHTYSPHFYPGTFNLNESVTVRIE